MRIDIISLFPEFIEAFFQHSIIGRARAAGLLDLDVTNPVISRTTVIIWSMIPSMAAAVGCS